jgi:dimethylargininase
VSRRVPAAAILAAVMRALVREVSPRLALCELSHLAREPIDAALAARQHRGYTALLQELGCRLEWLPPLPQHADGVFVEDAAVLLPELAVVTRPGVASRRGETASVAAALEPHLPLTQIGAPGCLDGGDVLQIGPTLFVGRSARSNEAGIAQLAVVLAPCGYRVLGVALSGCLHLKSACTFIPPDILLVNPEWVDPAVFKTARVIAVGPGAPERANTLTVAGTTLVSAAYPLTAQRLASAGVRTQSLEVGELHKAEAALTCLSLILGGES